MSNNPATRSILIEVCPDDIDGGYIATIVGLPGTASEGRTVGDAIRNVAEAYEGVRETLIALGESLG
jgi:predicted RNase H-like HicB family nuclease